MWQQSPVDGIGLGAYRSEFSIAKLALLEGGARMYSRGDTVSFSRAHNEVLEFLAECGLTGMAALIWGLAVLVGQLRVLRLAAQSSRAPPGQPDWRLGVAGCTAIAVLCMFSFPLRLALTGYPVLLFLAWCLSSPQGRVSEAWSKPR